MQKLNYEMTAYQYDHEFGLSDTVYRKEQSNNLNYFDKYKNKENFRIVIKDTNRQIVYSELDNKNRYGQ